MSKGELEFVPPSLYYALKAKNEELKESCEIWGKRCGMLSNDNKVLRKAIEEAHTVGKENIDFWEAHSDAGEQDRPDSDLVKMTNILKKALEGDKEGKE